MTPSKEQVAIAKKSAAQYAVTFVHNGMHIGLGTGSTAQYFIEELAKKCREGLNIKAVATSCQSHNLAAKGGIPLLSEEEINFLDLTVDGADEIDPHRQMIKGGGGALLREKIVASISREMIVIIDESKQVQKLGKFPLAVEIAPFAFCATIKALNTLGYAGALRKKNEQPFITDNGHFIYDIYFHQLLDDPKRHDLAISSVPGVMATGFFLGLASKVIMGTPKGNAILLP